MRRRDSSSPQSALPLLLPSLLLVSLVTGACADPPSLLPDLPPASLASSLHLIARRTLAPAGCASLSAVFVSPRGSDAACCNTAAAPCASLEAAVQRAASGATITLLPGVHRLLPASSSGLQLGGRPLTLTGAFKGAAPAAGNATLDCGGGPCLNATCLQPGCASAVLSLAAFSVVNGRSKDTGGCVSVSGQSLAMSDMTLSGCSAPLFGGAVFVSSGQLSVQRADITASAAAGSAVTAQLASGGGAIAVISSTSVAISGLSVSGCSSQFGAGGALQLQAVAKAAVRQSRFAGCSAFLGGAVASVSSDVVLQGITMSGCKAVHGGGYADMASSSVVISGLTASSCAATQTLDTAGFSGGATYGGALFLNTTDTASITAATVANCAADWEGGGIALLGITSGAAVDSTSVSGCSASAYGGGIAAETVPAFSLTNSTLNGNQLVETPASLFPYGGGLYVSDSNSEVVGCRIAGNGIFAEGGPSSGTAGQGGGVYYGLSVMVDPVHTVEKTAIVNNQAANGAGVISTGGTLNMAGSVVSGNSQAQFGGGMNIQSNATLTNCTFEGNSAVSSGGAIFYGAAASQSVTVTNCRFVNNEAVAADGGAIWVVQAPTNLTVTGSLFSGNRATASRGGAIFTGGSLVTVQQSSFDNNTAFLKGGAVAVVGTQQATTGTSAFMELYQCNFTRNHSPLGGGAVYASLSSTTSIDSSLLEGNAAPSGAAVIAQEMAAVTFGGSTCAANRAGSSGGCVAASDLASISADSSTFSANSAGSEGAAAWISGQATLSLTNCTVTGNRAPSGGAVWSEMQGVVTATNSTFSSNAALFEGGAIFATHTVNVSASSSSFLSNTAARGGAILVDAYARLAARTTFFSANNASALLARGNSTALLSVCTFTANLNPSGRGGAILTTDSAALDVQSSQLSGNSGQEGGAIYADATARIALSSNSFVANKAQNGAGVTAAGQSTIRATGLDFSGNQASAAGGGAAFLEQAHGWLTSSAFESNEAVVGGAGVLVERASVATQPLQPLQCSNLTFRNNSALYPEAVAFYEASYRPVDRIPCKNCTKVQPTQTVGSIPASFYFKWPGSSAVNWSSNGVFTVLTAVGSPVTDLQVVAVDSFGNVVSQDNTSLATVQSSASVSGLLRATAVNGVATIPPMSAYVTAAQAATPIPLTVTLTSPVAAYPPIVKTLNIAFCAAGQYFDAASYACLPCPVGSWCEAGQPATACADGSFTFYPSATDPSQCTACDDSNLDCTGGQLQVAFQAWLDMTSLNSTPTTYSCITSNGCNGYTYTAPDNPQCLEGFNEDVPMCSLCLNNYFSSLGYCTYCPSYLKTLFPLFIVLIVAVWIGFFYLTQWYTTFDIFLTEVQYITIIAGINLNPPANWVYRLINVYNLAVFDPDVIGPNCVMNYNFVASFVTGLIIVAAGLSVYLLRYLLFLLHERRRSLQAVVTCAGPLGEAAEQSSREREDRVAHIASLMQSALCWLDICYLTILVRVLPVFVPQQVGETSVLAFAPSIEWWSPTHVALFIPSVILMVVYVAGLPLFYMWVLFSARYNRTIHTEEFERTFGFLTEGTRRKFYWWHLVAMGLRLLYTFVGIFLYQYASVQISIVAIVQVLRIAIEYKLQPYEEGSHTFELAALNIGSLFFTLGLVVYNYVMLTDFSQACFAINVILMFGPALVFVLYDIANRRLEHFNSVVLEAVWEKQRHRYEKQLANLDVEQIIDLNEVGVWFRPYALFLFLRRRRHIHLLQQVRDRYQQCVVDGLGTVDWVDQLKKPQQYAGLSQILLGSRKGYIPIARLPANSVFCSRHGEWHEQGVCPDEGPLAPNRQRTFTRRRSRLRTSSMSSNRGGEAGAGEQEAAVPPAGSAPEEAGKAGKASKKAAKSIQIAEKNWPPKLERRIVWAAAGAAEGAAAEDGAGSEVGQRPATASGLSGGVSPSAVARQMMPDGRPSTAGGVAGVSATFTPPHGPRGKPGTPDTISPAMPRSVSVGGGDPAEARGTPDRTPSRAQSRSRSMERGGAGRGEDGEFVEATLDMAELTLGFQQNLALLVKGEKKRKAQKASLRHVVTSSAIYRILSWLTSESSTPEDQRLLGELIQAVRAAQQRSAKAIGWLNSLQSFYAGTSNLSRALEEELAHLQRNDVSTDEEE